MKSAYLRLSLPAAALLAFNLAPAAAQDRRPTPEQRIDRLERQVRQVQRQVFPKGQPADTALFSDEPAATLSSVMTLDQRIDALERQLASILRQAEENGHRVGQMEAELVRVRSEQDERIRLLEQARASAPAEVAAVQDDVPPPAPQPKVETASAAPSTGPVVTAAAATTTTAVDPGETAYDEGYQLWRTGKYDQAITSLRAMASSFPGHRRVSWAYNLAGRALLDKGEARAAAEALLANYRRDPKGERAADSLFYLGQSLMKLGQPGQACKAYAELEDVYGSNMRGELKRLLPTAKSEARCG